VDIRSLKKSSNPSPRPQSSRFTTLPFHPVGSWPSNTRSEDGFIRRIIATEARRGWVGGDFINRGEVRRRERSIEWMLSAPCTRDASSGGQLLSL